jgi:hypothetical protein
VTRNRKRFWGAIWSLKTGENKVQLFDAPNSPFNTYGHGNHYWRQHQYDQEDRS